MRFFQLIFYTNIYIPIFATSDFYTVSPSICRKSWGNYHYDLQSFIQWLKVLKKEREKKTLGQFEITNSNSNSNILCNAGTLSIKQDCHDSILEVIKQAERMLRGPNTSAASVEKENKQDHFSLWLNQYRDKFFTNLKCHLWSLYFWSISCLAKNKIEIYIL